MVSWAGLKLQDGLQWFAWRRSCCTIKLACLRRCMCISVRWLWHALNRCLEHQCMCRYVRYTDVCWHQFTYLETHPPPIVHVRSCMRTLFIHVGGRVWGGSASLHRALVDGVGVLIIHTGKRRRFVCISIFFWRGWSVCGCMREYTPARIHTHYKWGTPSRMWAQGLGRDTWRARRIQMDLMSAYLYSYTCTKYTCVYICWEAGWDLESNRQVLQSRITAFELFSQPKISTCYINNKSTIHQIWISDEFADQQWINHASTIDQQWVDTDNLVCAWLWNLQTECCYILATFDEFCRQTGC